MDEIEILKVLEKAEREAGIKAIKGGLEDLQKWKDKNQAPLRSKCKTSLERFRKTKELSQAKLSEISGVNIRMIQHYEQGVKDINKTQAITLYKLAQALECTIEDLLEV